ncbi:hypothetical protein CEXT_490051 [Caerostris extrusa]|uniref:Uncharacterized protein n=1 Tax=Caerostris extrusa TaxID=172846 RepID=A0AAV4QXU0_CAEEX|nr:hypothetical protein CEXT_490051 [Caerostris extrusa]
MRKTPDGRERSRFTGLNTPSSPKNSGTSPCPGESGRPERGHHFREKSSFISGSHLPAQISRLGVSGYLEVMRPHPAPLIAGIRYLMNTRFPGGGVPQEKGSVVFWGGRLD